MLNLILLFVLGLLPYVVAQYAACLDSTTYSWMYNSLRQSPCDIAAALGGVCTGGGFTIASLGPGDYYPGPSADNATPCRCNTVYYSILSACSVCQGADFVRFSSYTSNCATVYSQQYPEDIPADTAVPHYAYLDISGTDNFSVANARAAGGPESTRPPMPTLYPTSTSSISTSTSSISSTTISSTASSSTAVSTKETNVGAIAGGVGGGVAALAILGVLLFLLLRRPPPPAPSTPAQNPMMASQSPASFGGSPYSSSPPLPGSPPMFPSNYPSPNPSATFALPQQYPSMYANQVPTNYTGNTATSFTSGRPQYTGFPEP